MTDYNILKQPMPEPILLQRLDKLALLFWQKPVPADQQAIIWEAYLDELTLYPAMYVDEAITVFCREGGRFFPAISELVKIISEKHPLCIADVQVLEAPRREAKQKGLADAMTKAIAQANIKLVEE